MLKAEYNQPSSQMDILVFEKLVSENHYLRQVKEAVSFDFVYEIVSSSYSQTMGAPAEDPVLMLKLLFLQFHYRLSDREVIAQAEVNVAFRFFLDIGLEEDLPDHSSLSNFRTRLGVELFQKLFEKMVGQIRARGLIKDRLRLKDATHVIANIAIPSTISLVAQTRSELLNAARKFSELEVLSHEIRAVEIREATKDLKGEERLLHRVEHLREIVKFSDKLSAELCKDEKTNLESQEYIEFQEALETAHKVLRDREEKATDKLLSLVDKDARVGKHGDYYTGYNLDISIDADSEFICALDLIEANASEAANARELLESEEEAQGNDVEKLSIDSIGFDGKVLRSLTQEGGVEVEVFVPPVSRGNKTQELYQPSDFQLNEAKDELECPGGEKSRTRQRSSRNSGWKYHFSKRQCGNCPLRNKCLSEGTKSGRTVIKNDYEAEYKAALEVAQSAEYKDVRKQHPRVERKLADIIRWHGGRRVRYRTIVRAKIQYFLTAIVVNCKRLVKLLNNPQPVHST